MAVSLSTLLKPVSQADAQVAILGYLQTLGLPTTSWTTTSVPLVLVNTLSRLYADLTTLVSNVAAGGLLDYATGDWLTLLATSAYQQTRAPAVAAVVQVSLNDAGANGPTTIAVGQLYIADALGHRFFNSTGGTLPLSGSLLLQWTAESPGSAYNQIQSGATLVTPLPGVTITPASTLFITSGVDAQTDASLVAQCKAKWASLGTGGASSAYTYWATVAAPNVTRVFVDDGNPFGPGTVAVYLATATGAAAPADVALADASIQAKRALTATVTTLAATSVPIALTYTLNVRTAYQATAAAAALAAATSYINSLTMGSTVYASQIEAALGATTGVRDVTLALPAGNTTLSNSQVATLGTVAATVNIVS